MAQQQHQGIMPSMRQPQSAESQHLIPGMTSRLRSCDLVPGASRAAGWLPDMHKRVVATFRHIFIRGGGRKLCLAVLICST